MLFALAIVGSREYKFTAAGQLVKLNFARPARFIWRGKRVVSKNHVVSALILMRCFSQPA